MHTDTADFFILHQILDKHQIGYALVDANFVVVADNPVMQSWCPVPTAGLIGKPITESVPELIGSEDLLALLVDGLFEELLIPAIQRPNREGGDRYFDLHIEPCHHADTYLLFTATDVTRHAQRERRIRQECDELAQRLAALTAERGRLTHILERLVPTDVAADLIHKQMVPTLGGSQPRETTILFADMRDFTAVAEHYSPTETLDILNRYLAVTVAPIHKYGGSLIQVVGDMIMVSFNNPTVQADHACRAVLTASKMSRRIDAFIATDKPDWMPALRFGMGISTGAATAGYLGVESRYRYAVVGDTTNVAFHLCSRAAAGQILISQTTVDHLEDPMAVAALGNATLKRRREPIMIYELKR